MTEIEKEAIERFEEVLRYGHARILWPNDCHLALAAICRTAEDDKAVEEGRLVVLPCKVGDTVYTNQTWSGDYERDKDKPYCHKVVFVGLNGERDFFHTVNVKTDRMFNFDFADIGKTVFLTRQEAAEALGGGENG